MSSADVVQDMLDDVYAGLGVPARWTPAVGDPVAFTGLIGGGEVVVQLHGFAGQAIAAKNILKARVSELGGVAPRLEDRIELLNDDGSVAASFQLTAAARHPDMDARRLEWLLVLGDA